MADRKEKIINKIFKVLPMYEEGFEAYHKYLSRIIIELQGEEQTELLEEAIVALKGLKAQNNNVEHDEVRKIILRCAGQLSK